MQRMLSFDPLHACIAFGPLAMYLLVLGAINLSTRPLVTTGARDLIALGLAMAGLVVAGPMELFLIEAAAVDFGGWVVWIIMLVLYGLVVLCVALMTRPRLVIYNVTSEQLLPVLEEVLAKVDPQVRWVGNSIVSQGLGVQLTVEMQPVMKNVLLVSAGPQQSFSGWSRLHHDLAAALRPARGTPNPFGATLLTVGLMLAGIITWLMARDPSAVQQALNDMLRR
jgi:hypothetical protein